MEVRKVFPTAEEIVERTLGLQCPEANCNKMFKTKSNLNFHLVKHHKNQELSALFKKRTVSLSFFCPEAACPYTARKSFSSMKLLKQHYIKVHSAKTHLCSMCATGFGSETMRDAHEKYCGIMFTCNDCNVSYANYDTLKTHGRRKKHKVFAKVDYKQFKYGRAPLPTLICVLNTATAPTKSNAKQPFLLPKSIVLQQAANKSTQTLVGNAHNSKSISFTAGTQTELISVQSHILRNVTTKSTKKTQTNSVASTTRACNTSTDSSNCVMGDLDVETSSFGTQTLTTLSIQQTENETSTDDLFEYINGSNLCNAHTETQTDWLTDAFDAIDTDVYSDMCTQTCDEILPPALQFNNIHTQTMFNDVLRSVGSQTRAHRVHNSTNYVANIHTQTDIVGDILEEFTS